MSGFLLDSHVLYWWLNANKRLTPAADNAILNIDNRGFVSVTAFWEIAIESAKGHLAVPFVFDEVLKSYSFQLLPVSLEHVARLQTLPNLKQHRDPFNRMLVAQALHESLTLITRDARMNLYNVSQIKA